MDCRLQLSAAECSWVQTDFLQASDSTVMPRWEAFAVWQLVQWFWVTQQWHTARACDTSDLFASNWKPALSTMANTRIHTHKIIVPKATWPTFIHWLEPFNSYPIGSCTLPGAALFCTVRVPGCDTLTSSTWRGNEGGVGRLVISLWNLCHV
jgi:hypothetical protein